MVAWVAVERGKNVIKLRELGGGTETRTLAFQRSAFTVRWASDSSRLYFSQESDGENNHHLFVVDVRNPAGTATDLTPYPNTTYRWHRILPHDPKHVLIQLNLAKRSLFHKTIALFGIRPADQKLLVETSPFHLYKLDVESGALTLLDENPGDIVGWNTDRAGNPLARIRVRGHDWFMEARLGDGAWRKVVSGGAEDDFNPLGPTSDPRFVWAISNRGRDKAALVRVDLATGAETVVYQHPEVDVSGVRFNDDTREPVHAWVWPAYKEIHAFEDALGQELASFRSGDADNVTVLSSDRRSARLIVQVEAVHRPARYYLFDRERKTWTPLGASPAPDEADAGKPIKPIVVTTRDALSIPGYLLMPAGREGKPVPMVLLVHGGPWARDYPTFNPWARLLQTRGYAVLMMNYRGSHGYGRAFLGASRLQFGRAMQDDLADSVRWAVEQGIADPSKVAIMGFGYGGYAALAGLTFTPHLFAAAIDGFGAADLAHLAERLPRNGPRATLASTYIGEDRAEIAARSPINHLDRIARPLLLLEGEKAPRAAIASAERVVAAMRQAMTEVDYVVFPGERDALTTRENRLAAAARVEAFLARHLGARNREAAE
jgi:dipeptidyl aminopeptidase/acylaminoacyl peptidase